MEELVDHQRQKVLSAGQRLVPKLTMDDLLQPNDFVELENHPFFRYEEGVLAGLLTARTALYAAWKEQALRVSS